MKHTPHKLYAIGLFAMALAHSAPCFGMNIIEHDSNSILSASTANEDVKARIETEQAGDSSEHRKYIRILKVDITVDGVSINVPRSSFADIRDPRQAKVEFKITAGILHIDGGDGSDAYRVRIFFDRNRVTRRTLSSALIPNLPTEETHYFLRILKDE